jgi:hypothetical protein
MHADSYWASRCSRRNVQPRLLSWPLLVVLTGCGGGLPEVAPVRGTVTFDGKPLPTFKNAAVIFTPRHGRTAKSVISPADGSFDLSTYATGDGARIGIHSVTVSATVDDATVKTEKGNPGIRHVLPERFADRDTSGLVFDVKAGENVVEIQLRSNGTGEVVTK